MNTSEMPRFLPYPPLPREAVGEGPGVREIPIPSRLPTPQRSLKFRPRRLRVAPFSDDDASRDLG